MIVTFFVPSSRQPVGDVAAIYEFATAGNGYVHRFNWDTSGQMLKEFLLDYAAEPSRYQQRAHCPGHADHPAGTSR